MGASGPTLAGVSNPTSQNAEQDGCRSLRSLGPNYLMGASHAYTGTLTEMQFKMCATQGTSKKITTPPPRQIDDEFAAKSLSANQYL
jgi:hypothetical protein